ncbi:MAG: TraB/GumN family protein [Novosphingobium sp.]|nr:TraB/GumN family protein [Novosphingobium sp.]
MMRFRSALALCAAALCSLASFQAFAETSEPDTTPVEQVQITADSRPALWKIGDADTTIYLFGTIHVLPEGIDWFKGPVEAAFASSDTLVTEVAGNDEAKMQGLVVKLAVLPDGTSLRDQLAEDQRKAYEAALTSYNLPPAMFDRFEPWYAAIGLSTLPLIREGFSPDHGVEEALEKRAKSRQMEQQGLETVEYQLGLFDGLPEDVQKRYLGEVIGQLPKFRDEIRAMIEAWRVGDTEKLASLMNAEESDPVMIEELLTKRNRAWAKWLNDRLDQPGTVFVAVGAGHLAGAGSVQEQLAGRGIGAARVQ